MTLRKKSLALGSTVTLAGGATGASLLAMLIAASPAGATGTTYTVDTLADGVANSADCTTPVPGSCSLRDALDAITGGDSIVFASGVTGTISLTQGELEVSDDITLTGPGKDLLTIDAGGASRVFYVCGGPATVIEGLTITGGYESRGGGLYDECGNGTTLRNVVVSGNTANNGGGGIYASGDLTIIDSEISGNDAGQNAGGVYVSGALVMTGSVVSTNTSSVRGGGGVFAAGDVSIDSSTFESNVIDRCGGGLYAGVSSGVITITDSTFTNNSSASCYGGAIDIDGNYNTIVIANTTITGNSGPLGGGLHVDYGNTVSLFMDTISGNSATSTDPLYSGGGVHLYGGQTNPVTMTMVGTIVSGNIATAGPADIGIGTANSTGTYTASADNSLIGEVDSRLTLTGTGNVNSTTPGLSPLANNGGPTKTMALALGSPATDAGPSVIPTFTGNTYDQRGAGFARVVGTKSDIGAFETQAAPPTPTTTVPADDPVVPAFTG